MIKWLRRDKSHLVTIDWEHLCARHRVQRCAHHWVSDESIETALAKGAFDDPAVPHHDHTHRANRIATIVRMMQAGVVFKPVKLRIDPSEVHISDGHHRLRARQYLNRLNAIDAVVKGNLKRIKGSFILRVESQN